VAPDSVKAGEPAVVRVELAVWGAGGPVRGRYTGILAHYRLVGERAYALLRPARAGGGDDHHENYEFVIPPYPPGTRGEIEYYLEMKLDGHPGRIEGIHRITVAP
jgi:hypothetical protein